MNTKLTLRMDESLIAAAKDYAAAQGCSLSRMVANYFAALGEKATDRTLNAKTSASAASGNHWEQELGPFTRSILGIAKPTDGSPMPTEDDYYRYLEEKHNPK
ncbi:MAG: DUF6364 family protein [Rhodoferax sp.]|nr:DUF6364 family protein [Rhodoferax sp.]